MADTITGAQMRALERAAMDSGAVTGLELMERAGAGVVDAILEHWPDLTQDQRPLGGAAPRPAGVPRGIFGQKKPQAVVLCGPGNNGGDGFVVARLLRALGWQVEVFLFGDAERLPPDARVNHDRWLEMGPVLPFTACTPERWGTRPLMVDALFGIGVSRALPDALCDVLQTTLGCRRVAIDLPSGMHSETGQNLGAVAMDLTVTFHKAKPGHVLSQGLGLCGKLVIKDIGL